MTEHHNYSIGMSQRGLILTDLVIENFDLEDVLTNEGFSVNITRKSFAGVPVDKALELKINAIAKI